jgi:hypothetical protein
MSLHPLQNEMKQRFEPGITGGVRNAKQRYFAVKILIIDLYKTGLFIQHLNLQQFLGNTLIFYDLFAKIFQTPN